ncbi:hypothetical protein T484DRAFT_1764172 [Baffinella frigidus]|nr:hypothetical protein T484DRAFT_1764172 [Cryptophyta sp. CCMP2293]
MGMASCGPCRGRTPGAVILALLLHCASASCEGTWGRVPRWAGAAPTSPGGVAMFSAPVLRLRGSGSPGKHRREKTGGSREKKGKAEEEEEMGAWDGKQSMLGEETEEEEEEEGEGGGLEDLIRGALSRKLSTTPGNQDHTAEAPSPKEEKTKSGKRADESPKSPKRGGSLAPARKHREKDSKAQDVPPKKGGRKREVFESQGLEWDKPASDIEDILDALDESGFS